MTDNTQPEALRLAEQYDYGDPAAHSNTWKVAVCTELRRQHARIAELEAQLASIGAGGVSGPLMGQSFAAADMATASAQGFRDGVASLAANAGTNCERCSGSGEDPEGFYDQSRGDAGHTHEGPCRACDGSGVAANAGEPASRLAKYVARRKLAKGLEIEVIHGFDTNCESEAVLLLSDIEALLAAPPTAQAGGWMPIETAPKDGSEVLASTAGLGRIVVYWDDADSQWGTGLGYLHRDAPTHWMPLPPPPTSPADSRKGE